MFVINLCSSTSPVALSPPDHAGLKRFTFFVSRRREEGRERFRLHMGYFPTQEDAEKLLEIVREIYPGAWAGLAPGQRLRAAAAAVAAAKASAAPAPAPQEAAPPALIVPVTPVASAAAPVQAAPVQEMTLQLMPEDGPRRRLEPDDAQPLKPEQSVSAQAAAEAAEKQAATRSLHEVRAAIASLEDSNAGTPVLRLPADLKIPELKPAVVPFSKKPLDRTLLKPVENTAEQPVLMSPGTPVIDPAEVLSETAAMSVLETGDPRRENRIADKAAVAASAFPAASPEKPCFAVQLMWSVSPIDVAQVPQLAIFSAYTLYGAQGNREGRRWYGLRLGFFTDAVSAKQVAHYVRSEFSTVSVVPVTVRERERAKLASTRPAVPAPEAQVRQAPVAKPTSGALVSTTRFDFIEDKAPGPAATGPTVGQPATKGGAPSRFAAASGTGKGAPGKRAKFRTPAQLAAKAAASAKPKKLTLEETLEILGAGDLKVDDGRGELLNTQTPANTARAKPDPKGKPSRLGRLFERLSERIGN